jgi:hypothetical protein
MESLVILSPAKEWMCLGGDESQHNRHRDGCGARSRSSTSPTDERYNAETESQCRSPQKTQIVSPLIKARMGADNSLPETQIGTHSSLPIKARMGTDSCSLPEMQIGAKTQKRPQMTQITQSDTEEAQIDTEYSREMSAWLIACWR